MKNTSYLYIGAFVLFPLLLPKKSFKYNEKRKGYKCTPCRTPTLVRKKSEYSSPLKTRDFTLLYIFIYNVYTIDFINIYN
jgi:hypothetical protein